MESAQVRKKNQRYVATKNLLIILVSLVSFYVLGYAFAFGKSTEGIFGAQYEYVGVFSTNGLYHERQFPFYLATCFLPALIVSGSVSERTRLVTLLGFIILMNTIIYPVIMSWAWNPLGGYLRALGFFDRGGSVIIFQTGAVAGVMGSLIVGPRYGRFMLRAEENRITNAPKELKPKPLQKMMQDAVEEKIDMDDMFMRKLRRLIKKAGQENDFYLINNSRMVLGTAITIIGWAYLNACGSGNHPINTVVGRYAAELGFMNTFIAGSFSSFTAVILKRHIVKGDNKKTQRYDIKSLCNGYLAGVAAVSAGAGTMKPWSALVTGLIAAFLYMTVCLIMKKIKYDDPMENFQIYGSAGFWGMVSSIFFIPNTGIIQGGKDSGSLLGI